MLHVFIDSNIYLRFYAYSEDTFEELEKFQALAEADKITIYVTTQIHDEISRNREAEIFRSLEKFQKSAAPPEVPRFAGQHAEAKALIAAGKTVAEAKSALAKKIGEEISAGELRADQLVQKLTNSAKKIDATPELIARACIRRDTGNPPGKPETLGDQINWEALLNDLPADSDLHIVTDDRDFFSKLETDLPSAFLLSEWKVKNGGDLSVYRSLGRFTKIHFSDIKLPADVIKSDAISKLVSTGNFSWTHKQIARLDEIFDQLTYEDAIILFQAMIDNAQINWIAKDPDVQDFYSKLYAKFGSKVPTEIDEQLEGVADYLPIIPF